MPETETICEPNSAEEKAEKIEVAPQGSDITKDRDDGVLKEILQAGTGDEYPLNGDTVYVHYVGKLLDGTQFDASKKEKFQFVVGEGSVIKAWELGVPTMRRGEKARFCCQPKYAYGKKGSPPKIAANATLVFDIELFSWRGEDVSEKKDGGVLKSRLKDGDGTNPPKDGAVCKIHVLGRHDGRQFVDRDYRLTLGEGSEVGLVDGIEQALRTFKSGEKAVLKVKAKYAYGEEGHTKYNIPPNADLVFEVHLESYDPFKEGWMMDDDERLSAAAVMKVKGTKYFQEGKFKFAARYYSRIIEFLVEEDTLRGDEAKQRHALMLAAHLNMAACHLKLDANLDAVHDCDEALKLDDKNEKAFYRRATAYMNMHNYESAVDDYKALLDINPNNKLARDQITTARQKIAEIQKQEKNMYSKMFQKKPQTEVLKLWKNKKEDESCEDGDLQQTEGNAVDDRENDTTGNHEDSVATSSEDSVANNSDNIVDTTVEAS